MINQLLKYLKVYVYVVVAYDTDKEKMRECKVFWSSDQQQTEALRLKEVYGGANVMIASRRVL